jgi:tRNA pseudouridine38-40 synthase
MAAPAVPVPTRTIRLDLEYDGAGFVGWQRQPDGRTVQGVLEDALGRLLGARSPVVGAGRTDAGVHARGMVASLRTASAMEPAVLHRALDAVLPEDLGVLAVSEAPPAFHARRDARWKWYRYSILRSRTRRVFLRRTAWRVGAAVDAGRVREAAAALSGRHDFAAFQSAGSPRRSTVRRLALAVSEDGPMLHLDAVGDGFLYGMVRAVAGTLAEVGRGHRTVTSVSSALAARDRSLAGPAAPAHGLCLMAVGYDGDPEPAFVDRPLETAVESPASESRRPRPCGS